MHTRTWRARARAPRAARVVARVCVLSSGARARVCGVVRVHPEQQREQQGQGQGLPLRSVTPSPHAAGAQRLTQLRVGPRVPQR